jgi:hypothetical protein
VVLAVFGCASLEDSSSKPQSKSADYARVSDSLESNARAGESMPQPPEDRILIKTGTLDIVVMNAQAALGEVAGLLRQYEGFESARQSSAVVANRELLGPSEVHSVLLTLKIPADRFDDFLQEVKALGSYTSEQISVEDVTMQYVDLEARLKSHKAVEKRLAAHLDKADNIEGIVQIEKELSRVREQIESLSAQFKVLQDQVAFSTLLLEMAVRPDWVPPADRTLWEDISDTFGSSIGALGNTLRALLVYGVAFLPWVFLLSFLGSAVLIPAVLIRRKLDRHKQSRTGK